MNIEAFLNEKTCDDNETVNKYQQNSHCRRVSSPRPLHVKHISTREMSAAVIGWGPDFVLLSVIFRAEPKF